MTERRAAYQKAYDEALEDLRPRRPMRSRRSHPIRMKHILMQFGAVF